MRGTLRTRLGSAALALALVLSALPVSAMAEEGTPAAAGETVTEGVAQIGEQTYPTLEEAFGAVGSEAVTIRLLADTQISNTITVAAGQTITLDLNGCAVSVPTVPNGSSSIYAIHNYGTLTIRDTSAEQDGSISARGMQNLENGILTLESGTINAIDSNGGGAAMWNEATFYMTGGTLAFTGEKSGNSAGAPLNNQFGAYATITGGSVISPYTCVFNSGHMKISNVSLSGQTAYWHVIKTYGGSDLELRNVTVNATVGGGMEAAGGTVDIYDCTFTQQGYYDWNSVNVAVSNNGTVNVHSGTFTSENYGAYVFTSGGTINIEGGTFHAGKAVLKADNSNYDTQPSVIHVTGGTITGTFEVGSKATLDITGGTFSSDPSNYVPAGMKVEETNDGQYSVVIDSSTAVAEVNGAGYTTLADAVSAVESGETITLLQDVSDGSGIIIPSGSDFTIDFAGHTYTVTNDLAGSTGTKSQCFQVLRDSSITMKNGAIVANDSGIKMIVQNYADLTLDGMTLDATQGTNSVNYVMSNNCGNVTITGDTTITARDGKFAFDVYYWPAGGYGEGVTVTVDENMTGTITGKIEYASDGTQADVADKARLNMQGGTFNGSIVTAEKEHGISITGGTFSSDPGAYVADGYIVKRDGSETYAYTVLAKSNLTAGTYLSDPTGFTASNYYVTDNQDGTWTVYYSAPSSGSTSGNKTETTTNSDGSTTTTVTRPDGSKTETTKAPDGSSSVVNTSKDGQVSAAVTVSGSAVSEAEDAVALPMPELPVTSDRSEAPTVTVKLPSNTAAKVEIPVENVTAGTVAILVKADGTEEIVKTSVTTENGVALTVENGAQVKIVDNSKNFTDVQDGYWGEDEIDFATSRELFNGTSATTFSPENTMTRAMVVTVLARYEGVDTANGDTWYAAGSEWAVENGISDGSNLDGSVTREQLVTMLYRYAGEPAVSGTVTGFSDAAAVSSYAEKAMAWALENGILNGMSDGTLNPQGTATRAQVAAILARFVAAAN